MQENLQAAGTSLTDLVALRKPPTTGRQVESSSLCLFRTTASSALALELRTLLLYNDLPQVSEPS